jgi:hypothetical protein
MAMAENDGGGLKIRGVSDPAGKPSKSEWTVEQLNAGDMIRASLGRWIE